MVVGCVSIIAFVWYGIRSWNGSAERAELLEAARGSAPDVPDRLQAYLAKEPDDAEMVEALVDWQLRTNVPFAEMEPYLDRLCALRPDEVHGFRLRASLRSRNGRLAEGLADGLRVLELDPSDDATRSMVANVAAEAGQYEIAVREYTQLLDSPKFPREETAAKLVDVHLEAGNAQQAEQVLSQYLLGKETDPAIQLLRCRVLQATDRHSEAIVALRNLADASRHQRESALFHLAQSQTALGQEAAAQQTLEELEAVKMRIRAVVDAAQRPDDMPAQVRAAEVLLADEKPQEAAVLLEHALRRNGGDPAAARVLAAAYRALGRVDLAKQWEQAFPK